MQEQNIPRGRGRPKGKGNIYRRSKLQFIKSRMIINNETELNDFECLMFISEVVRLKKLPKTQEYCTTSLFKIHNLELVVIVHRTQVGHLSFTLTWKELYDSFVNNEGGLNQKEEN